MLIMLCFLSEDPLSLKFFSIIWTVVYVYLGCFALSKCEILLHDWIGSNPDVVYFSGAELDDEDRFSYLGRCILSGGRISGEVASRIQKIRLTFINWCCEFGTNTRAHRSNIYGCAN